MELLELAIKNLSELIENYEKIGVPTKGLQEVKRQLIEHKETL